MRRYFHTGLASADIMRSILYILYCLTKYGAYFAATSMASIMLTGLAIPFPAISYAVPWSTEVLRIGRPFVTDMVRSKSRVFVAM